MISCSVEANPSASVILQNQLTKPNHAGISTSYVGAVFINTTRDGALAHHWKVPVPGKQLMSLIVMLLVIQRKIYIDFSLTSFWVNFVLSKCLKWDASVFQAKAKMIWNLAKITFIQMLFRHVRNECIINCCSQVYREAK